MNKVKITPTKEGNLVTSFKSNPEFGYMKLTETAVISGQGWFREVSKTCLQKGKMSTLQAIVSANSDLCLNGKLTVKEYLANEITADVISAYVDDSVSVTQGLETFKKRAGKDGIALTVQGQAIYRFTIYDPSGTTEDTVIAHDNVEAVKLSRVAATEEAAL